MSNRKPYHTDKSGTVHYHGLIRNDPIRVFDVNPDGTIRATDYHPKVRHNRPRPNWQLEYFIPGPRAQALQTPSERITAIRAKLNKVGMRLAKAQRIGDQSRITKLECVRDNLITALIAITKGKG